MCINATVDGSHSGMYVTPGSLGLLCSPATIDVLQSTGNRTMAWMAMSASTSESILVESLLILAAAGVSGRA